MASFFVGLLLSGGAMWGCYKLGKNMDRMAYFFQLKKNWWCQGCDEKYVAEIRWENRIWGYPRFDFLSLCSPPPTRKSVATPLLISILTSTPSTILSPLHSGRRPWAHDTNVSPLVSPAARPLGPAARDARFVAARMRRRACHSVQSQLLLPTAAAAAAPVAVALYFFPLPQLATPQLLGLGFRSVTPLPRG